MGVFRLSSSEKGKGRRNAPPFSPPPPASTRPPREPHPNEWYPQSHEQYPPRVISLDGPDPEINEEDHDAPVLHPPASPASVMDNIYKHQSKNALDHIQARGRQPEGCLPQYLPQSQEAVDWRTQAPPSSYEASLSMDFIPIARPHPAELALFDTVWKDDSYAASHPEVAIELADYAAVFYSTRSNEIGLFQCIEVVLCSKADKAAILLALRRMLHWAQSIDLSPSAIERLGWVQIVICEIYYSFTARSELDRMRSNLSADIWWMIEEIIRRSQAQRG